MKMRMRRETRARKTNILGSVALGRRKKRPQEPIKRMRSLKAKLINIPSQVTSHSKSSRLSKAPICGRATIRIGLKKAAIARMAEVTGPRYWPHRDMRLLSLVICHLERSSIAYSISELFVTAVVVSPQFSS